MACVALDLGFKAELINYNLSNICDADIAKLKVKKLIERLKRQKKKNRPNILSRNKIRY